MTETSKQLTDRQIRLLQSVNRADLTDQSNTAIEHEQKEPLLNLLNQLYEDATKNSQEVAQLLADNEQGEKSDERFAGLVALLTVLIPGVHPAVKFFTAPSVYLIIRAAQDYSHSVDQDVLVSKYLLEKKPEDLSKFAEDIESSLTPKALARFERGKLNQTFFKKRKLLTKPL